MEATFFCGCQLAVASRSPPSQCSVVLVVYGESSQSVDVSAAILSGVHKKYQAVGSDVSEGKYCLIYQSSL